MTRSMTIAAASGWEWKGQYPSPMEANGIILRNHPYREQGFASNSSLGWKDLMPMLLGRELRGDSTLVAGYRVQIHLLSVGTPTSLPC